MIKTVSHFKNKNIQIYTPFIKLVFVAHKFISIFAPEKPKRFLKWFKIILLKMSMKEVIIGFGLLILAYTSGIAQERDAAKPQILISLAQSDGQVGQIEIIQPVQVENLLKMQIANNNLQEGIPGYRIQIFSDSGQQADQKANEARVTFMRNFPELEAYKKYYAPNFQIYVGDFRTKNEALRGKKKIEKIFPRAFIISDIINIPK